MGCHLPESFKVVVTDITAYAAVKVKIHKTGDHMICQCLIKSFGIDAKREDPPGKVRSSFLCVVRLAADKGKLKKITGKQLSCASLSTSMGEH